jgi:hypothetical protein
MVQSEMPSTAAGNGGPQSTTNALNITSLGSSQLQSTNQESNSVKQNLLKTQNVQGSIRAKARKHSVFSISNFSGNMTDAEPRPANKTQHPPTRQAVAWEIKFK